MARRLRRAMVLAVALSRPATAGVFADVPWCGWFYNAVEKMASLEAVQGYADGTFRGPQPLSRDEFAVAIMQFRPAATSAMWAALGGYPTAIARVTERQETERLQIQALRTRHEDDLSRLTIHPLAVDAKLTDEATRLHARLDGLAAADLAPLTARLRALDSKVNAEATRLTTAVGETNDLAARHASDMDRLTASVDGLAGSVTALQSRTQALEHDVTALWKLFGRQTEDAKAVVGTLAASKAVLADLGDGVR